MTDGMRSRTARRATTVIAAVLLIAGAVTIAVAVHAQRKPPQPKASAAGRLYIPPSTTTTSVAPTTTHPKVTTPSGLPASPPVAVTIPAIGVQSNLIHLGLNPDGTVQVPTSFHVAGWYDQSVTPGQVGPTIILGHVDSKAGPGIFFRLGALKPGDDVAVKRTDGRTVTFKITAVRSYFKQQFPTIDVYGNTPTPTIRLITCGGTFDRSTGHYLSNIVAYGQIVTSP
jgi:sortase (surface protein transpeptidase)